MSKDVKRKGEDMNSLFEAIQEKPKEGQKFVAVDVETTGLSPLTSELIEVSAIKYENFHKVETYTSFIKPVEPIPQKITELTGITNTMVKDARPVWEVMQEVIAFIGNCTIVAHNAPFDVSFLQVYSNNSFSKNKVVDTVKLGRKMYPHLINHKLATIAHHIGITETGFHRAEVDCECCAKIYLEYLKQEKEA